MLFPVCLWSSAGAVDVREPADVMYLKGAIFISAEFTSPGHQPLNDLRPSVRWSIPYIPEAVVACVHPLGIPLKREATEDRNQWFLAGSLDNDPKHFTFKENHLVSIVDRVDTAP